jgi:tyrosinase
VKVELLINNSAEPRARYLTWAPSPCRIRVSDPTDATDPVSVTVGRRVQAGGGSVVFRTEVGGASSKTVRLDLPLDGESVTFFALGEFEKPSSEDGDVVIEATSGSTLVAEVPVMVRVRKNANTLTEAERDRFVNAMATLNNQGTGRFADFRNMHKASQALRESHGAQAFLPWHRAYLLDLERELQAIDSSVSLPYWKFDEPAPFLFTPEFLGTADQNGDVTFSATNPLQFWKTDAFGGINRMPEFDTVTEGAPDVFTEDETLAFADNYQGFRVMEGNPHGTAHVSFGGFVSDPRTAPRDPLFFLLHANVDRLWAKWQRRFDRFDHEDADAYESNGTSGNRIGHNLADTMWPWNGVTTPPRPADAPGGELAPSDCVAAPGASPRVRSCLDYQGRLANGSRMGFDYDDAQFD